MEYVRQWLEGKTPPAQVAAGDDHQCASGVFAPFTLYMPLCKLHSLLHRALHRAQAGPDLVGGGGGCS